MSLATLEQALIWARQPTAAAATRSGAGIVNAALEEGLRSNAPKAPIRWPEDLADDDRSDEQRRRAALIAGHLLRDRLRDGAALSEPVALAAIAYASALATPQAQRVFAHLHGLDLLKVHTYACVLSERHGHEIAENEEISLFEWLLGQADLTLTTTLRGRMLSLRTRRLERLRA